ncbi:MAG: sigma-70 family RNA polymerase sigma factor [Nostoc sp. GBBB01]|nr:sigma-70 family RNA polymerase sigma factor [Nostoc sp. GBBB01]
MPLLISIVEVVVVVKQETDAELVNLARLGDKNAFGQLIERYQSMTKRIAMGMIANEDTAKDLAQEAMLQAYLCLDSLRDSSRFQNWLYGIVLNVCRSYIRSRKAVFFSLEEISGGMKFDEIPLVEVVPDPQKVAQEQEIYNLVLEAINSLSPKNRTATLLFYEEQLSLQEISALLGVSVTAIKGRLHKARQQLKAQLLPVFSDDKQTQFSKHRRNNMILVTIADVMFSKMTDSHAVLLWDRKGRRVLPIYIGKWEAESIALGVNSNSLPRPLTYKFIATLMEVAGAKLESIRIDTLKSDTFYAVVSLRSGDKVHEVDARPSDAMALAVQVKCPIYVTEEVLESASIKVPPGIENEPYAKGLEEMNLHREQEKREQEEKLQQKITEYSNISEEERSQRQQKFIDYLFSRDVGVD